MELKKKVRRLRSSIFALTDLQMPGNTTEQILKGGRDLFHLLPKGFSSVKNIGCIGWGSQGPAQFCNLRDSLTGTDVKVTVGLRRDSSSWGKAEKEGFSEKNGSLGEMFDVIRNSDMVILLISDAAQTELYQEVMVNMKPGSTLGLSHGFLLGYMQSIDSKWRDDINVIAVCPKGMGPSVRQLYLQGVTVNGAGINSSIAIEQDINGNATDLALAWAVAIGSPYVFTTTMESEFKSDIFGERGILLGGVWAIVEALYERYCSEGMLPEYAYSATVECITGPISDIISKKGIKALYEKIQDKADFRTAYSASYDASMPVLRRIYNEVASGNEISSVIISCEKLKTTSLGNIYESEMWNVGKKVRANRTNKKISIYPVTAGMYAGMMMAQIELLTEKGHSWSEIANESVIEAVDSLNPYMRARGVSYMVDNCSITARLGARKWQPLFKLNIQHAFDYIDRSTVSHYPFLTFLDNPIHEALAVCSELRPSVDISVS